MSVDQIIAGVQNRDLDLFQAGFGSYAQALGQGAVPPGQVAADAVRLAELLRVLPWGVGSQLAQMVGGLADFGAEPAAVLPVLVDRAIEVIGTAHGYFALAAHLGVNPPEERSPEAFPVVMEEMQAAAAAAGGPDPGTVAAHVEAVFAGGDWLQPVLFLSQRRDARDVMPRRAELTEAVASARELFGQADFLYGTLCVLDDEPLLVVDRATARAWECRISGVGDNGQLRTLLAARLAAAIPIEPPTPVEMAAADDGDELMVPGGIEGRFHLSCADGSWIWVEGRPSDITFCDGVRVAVLDPLPFARSWNPGRIYPMMKPTVTVVRALPADEARSWAAKLKPFQSFGEAAQG